MEFQNTTAIKKNSMNQESKPSKTLEKKKKEKKIMTILGHFSEILNLQTSSKFRIW